MAFTSVLCLSSGPFTPLTLLKWPVFPQLRHFASLIRADYDSCHDIYDFSSPSREKNAHLCAPLSHKSHVHAASVCATSLSLCLMQS